MATHLPSQKSSEAEQATGYIAGEARTTLEVKFSNGSILIDKNLPTIAW